MDYAIKGKQERNQRRYQKIIIKTARGNSTTEWRFDPGEERPVRDRHLPDGLSMDLAATDLDPDRTRFNDRGLPDPGNLGTMVLLDSSGGQGHIRNSLSGDGQTG